METDEQLDLVDKTKGEKRVMAGHRVAYHICISFFFIILIASCSLPRIIVLDDPLSPQEHLNLGVAYEKKAEFGPAIDEYKKASKKIPLAYVYMGNAYIQKGELGKAEESYKTAIDKDQTLADAYNNLAWLYYTKNEDLSEAEVLAAKALALDPKNKTYQDTLSKIRERR